MIVYKASDIVQSMCTLYSYVCTKDSRSVLVSLYVLIIWMLLNALSDSRPTKSIKCDRPVSRYTFKSQQKWVNLLNGDLFITRPLYQPKQKNHSFNPLKKLFRFDKMQVNFFFKSCWFMSHFILNIFKMWYLVC